MGMIEQAFAELFPGRDLTYVCHIKYSARFKGYNANAVLRNKQLTFNLSKQWRQISPDIKIGLLQELFCKIMGVKKQTQSIELYHIFLKKVHIAVPKDKTHPVLQASFERMNEQFFSGLLELPNLVWGKDSIRKFGSYDYGADTISMSRVLEDKQELLDYVMYHEMLHKKHKFKTLPGKTYHHTPEFKRDERAFPNREQVERQLGMLATRKKLGRLFGF